MKAFAAPLLVTLVIVLTANPVVRADEEDGIPSFRTTPKRDTREFVTKVGTAVVKAARARPGTVELSNYSYAEPKPGRHLLKIEMTYKGTITRKLFRSDVRIKIDSTDRTGWEVLDIEYADDNKLSAFGPNRKKIRALIPLFNK